MKKIKGETMKKKKTYLYSRTNKVTQRWGKRKRNLTPQRLINFFMHINLNITLANILCTYARICFVESYRTVQISLINRLRFYTK